MSAQAPSRLSRRSGRRPSPSCATVQRAPPWTVTSPEPMSETVDRLASRGARCRPSRPSRRGRVGGLKPRRALRLPEPAIETLGALGAAGGADAARAGDREAGLAALQRARSPCRPSRRPWPSKACALDAVDRACRPSRRSTRRSSAGRGDVDGDAAVARRTSQPPGRMPILSAPSSTRMSSRSIASASPSARTEGCAADRDDDVVRACQVDRLEARRPGSCAGRLARCAWRRSPLACRRAGGERRERRRGSAAAHGDSP